MPDPSNTKDKLEGGNVAEAYLYDLARKQEWSLFLKELRTHQEALVREAQIDEITKARHNFIPEQKRYYQDPVKYLDDRLTALQNNTSGEAK